MNLMATPLKAGRAVDFGSTGRPLAWYQAAAHSINAVVLDMMTPGWLTDYGYALEAGLGVMLFQGYWSPAFAMPGQAHTRATMMVTAAQDAHLAPGTTVWLDLEAVPASVTATAMATWVNTWATEIIRAGFRPGLYVGANQPLSGPELYTLLTAIHCYWESCSTVPQVATRGYAMRQTQCSGTLAGQTVDWDTIQTDLLGGTVIVTHQESARAAAPTPGAGPTLADLQTQITALSGQVNQLKSSNKELSLAVAKILAAQKTAGQALMS